MGDLKALHTQQESLASRAREINRKLWLAGLGAVSKAEEEGRKQIDKYVFAGEQAIGSKAALKHRYVVAARGLIVTLRDGSDNLLNRLVEAGKNQQGKTAAPDNTYMLAAIGAVATLRDGSQKFFDDLVATGEKRQSPHA